MRRLDPYDPSARGAQASPRDRVTHAAAISIFLVGRAIERASTEKCISEANAFQGHTVFTQGIFRAESKQPVCVCILYLKIPCPPYRIPLALDLSSLTFINTYQIAH
jgi:hypothetical protein